MEKKSERQDPTQVIPSELWELILSRLPDTWKTFRLVCRTWKNVIDCSPLFFQPTIFRRQPSRQNYFLPIADGVASLYHAEFVSFNQIQYLVTVSQTQQGNNVTVCTLTPTFSVIQNFQISLSNDQATRWISKTLYTPYDKSLYAIFKLEAPRQNEMLQSWDLINGKLCKTLTLQEPSIHVEATQDGTLTTYHAASPYYQQYFFPEGTTIKALSLPETQQKLLALLDRLNIEIQFFMLRPNCAQLITFAKDNSIQIWDEHGKELAYFLNMLVLSSFTGRHILYYAEDDQQQLNVITSTWVFNSTHQKILNFFSYDLKAQPNVDLMMQSNIDLWKWDFHPNENKKFTATIQDGYVIAKGIRNNEIETIKIFHPTAGDKPVKTFQSQLAQRFSFLNCQLNMQNRQAIVIKQKTVGFISQDDKEKTQHMISILDYSFASIFSSQQRADKKNPETNKANTTPTKPSIKEERKWHCSMQ